MKGGWEVDLGGEIRAFCPASKVDVRRPAENADFIGTKSPFYISLVSQIALPIGMLFTIQVYRPLVSNDIWVAIVLGHFTRCALSVLRFRQERWRQIRVDLEPATG